jgi:hypothetical protein
MPQPPTAKPLAFQTTLTLLPKDKADFDRAVDDLQRIAFGAMAPAFSALAATPRHKRASAIAKAPRLTALVALAERILEAAGGIV